MAPSALKVSSEAFDSGEVETIEGDRKSREMVPKSHFLVFCAIFLTVVLLLGLGAWHTRAEIERRGAPGRLDDPSPASAATPAQRLANPPPQAAAEGR